MILIICAIPCELEQVLELSDTSPNLIPAPFPLYEIRIAGNRIRLCLCGIGKARAAMTLAHICATECPELVINLGTAGGLVEDQRFEELILAERCAYHDLCFDVREPVSQETQAFSARLSERLLRLMEQSLTEVSIPYRRGLLVSGDQFIETREQISTIKDRYPDAVAVDMESNALAQTAKLYRLPFLALRGLSDICLRAKPDEFYEHADAAARNAAAVLRVFLTRLSADFCPDETDVPADFTTPQG